jgi:hypothetical protein
MISNLEASLGTNLLSNETPEPRLQDAGNRGRIHYLAIVHHFEQPRWRYLVNGDNALGGLGSAEIFDCRRIKMNAST